ncbi:MAG: hypothetical protein AB7G48_09410 [Nitrospiraceae bacterium]
MVTVRKSEYPILTTLFTPTSENPREEENWTGLTVETASQILLRMALDRTTRPIDRVTFRKYMYFVETMSRLA